MPKRTSTPWYRDSFAHHPRYTPRARCPSCNIHGKRKAWCRPCLERRIVEVEAADAFQAIDSTMRVVRSREAIIEECKYWLCATGGYVSPTRTVWSLPQQQAGLIEYRHSQCLVHLRDCVQQRDDVREAARIELEHINRLRRTRSHERSARLSVAAAVGPTQPMPPLSTTIVIQHPTSGQPVNGAEVSMAETQDAPVITLPYIFYSSTSDMSQSITLPADVAGLSLASTSSSPFPSVAVSDSLWYTGEASFHVSAQRTV